MNSATSSNTSKASSSDQTIIGLLAAGAFFVVGYTLVRTLLLQPIMPSEGVVINSVVPHEATLWNADIDGF